jgi:hypothetical protein
LDDETIFFEEKKENPPQYGASQLRDGNSSLVFKLNFDRIDSNTTQSLFIQSKYEKGGEIVLSNYIKNVYFELTENKKIEDFDLELSAPSFSGNLKTSLKESIDNYFGRKVIKLDQEVKIDNVGGFKVESFNELPQRKDTRGGAKIFKVVYRIDKLDKKRLSKDNFDYFYIGNNKMFVKDAADTVIDDYVENTLITQNDEKNSETIDLYFRTPSDFKSTNLLVGFNKAKNVNITADNVTSGKFIVSEDEDDEQYFVVKF